MTVQTCFSIMISVRKMMESARSLKSYRQRLFNELKQFIRLLHAIFDYMNSRTWIFFHPFIWIYIFKSLFSILDTFIQTRKIVSIMMVIFFTYQWKISPDLVYNDFEFVDKDIIHESIFIFISFYTVKLF